MFRRRRPLLRAAAVGGGAYAMGKHRARGQQAEADQDQRIDDLESQQPAPAPAAAPTGGISSEAVQKLQELAKLRDQGILTEDEFATQKERLLAT
jgi:Short C-terminal domain